MYFHTSHNTRHDDQLRGCNSCGRVLKLEQENGFFKKTFALKMKKPSLKYPKINVLKLILSQGLMNELDATNLIRQGRVRVLNKIQWDPKRGLTLRPGTPFLIDKHRFYYYPYLYLLYNKPQHVVCSFDSPQSSNSFPICFLNRSKPIKPVLSLPSNMSGLTVYSDDEALISHVQKNRDSIDKHVFEVQFVHRREDVSINEEDNLHYTDWNALNSLEFINKLYEGVDVHATKNKKAFKSVSIDDVVCIDSDFNNEHIQYNHIRISKWKITMSKYPKSLYRLLRSVGLSPYYIHRISIGDNIGLNECSSNEWRVMHEKEIEGLAQFNQHSPYTTQIDIDSTMSSQKSPNINKLFKTLDPQEMDGYL